MAISEVTSQRSTNGGAASTSVSFVYPATPTQGNLLVAMFSFRTGATVTVVPSGWTLAGASSGTGNIAGCVIYWKIAGASEATAHTWTLSASVKSAGVGTEFNSTTGWETTPNTQNNGAVGTAATINTGNVITANTPELVVAVGAQDTSDALTAATTSSWIEVISMASTGGPTSSRNRTTAAYRGASAADLDSPAGTYSETFTGTDTLAKAARIASFQPSAEGGGTTGSGTVGLPVLTASGAGAVPARGTGTAALPVLTASGTGPTASTLDDDFLTSSVTGAPAAWETQCLQVVRNDTEKYLEHDPVDQAKLYWRTETIMASHAIPADTDDSVFFRLVDSGGNILIQARWRNTGGNLRVRFQVATATPGTLADHDYTTNLALDTSYRIEGLWDSTGDVWAVRVDGNAVANGTLTSTSATTSIDKVRIGTMGTGTAQTYYMDLVAGATDDWIGPETAPITGAGTVALPAVEALATGQGPIASTTTTWFFRNGTGVACGPGTRRDLLAAAGSAVATQDISSEHTWNMQESPSRKVGAGDWTLTLRVTTGSGGGGPNKVSAVIERRNSACVVQETILSQQSGNLTAGATETVTLTQSAVGQVNFAANDILTIRVVRSAGGRAQTLRFNGADPDNTRILHPATLVELVGAGELPALQATAAGTVGGAAGTIEGSGATILPGLTVSGTTTNSRKLAEYFEAVVGGYDNVGWFEIIESGSSINPLFGTSGVPGGKPSGWGSQCLQVVRVSGLETRTASPTFPFLNTAYSSIDVVIGSENMADDDVLLLCALGTAAFPVIAMYLRQTGGDLRYRFEVETSEIAVTTHDWATSVVTGSRYIIEFFWDINTDSYEIWINGVSAFSGSTTATRKPNRVFLGGRDTATGSYTAYFDRIGVDTLARLPQALTELPALTATAAGTVPAAGQGTVALPALSLHFVLTADSTIATADSSVLTADLTKYPVSEGAGGVGVGGTSAVGLPALFAFGEGVTPIAGAAATTLPALTATATGEGAGAIEGVGTADLQALAASGQGEVLVDGAAVAELPALTAGGQGAVAIAGVGSIALPALQVAGASSSAIAGAGAVALPALNTSGVGEVPARGAAAIELPALTVVAEGSVAIVGSGAAALPAVTASGAGVVPLEGAGTVVLPALTASGTGVGQAAASGEAAITLPALTTSGQGEVPAVGSGSAALPALASSGTGQVPAQGGAAISLPGFTITAQGEVDVAGAGTAALPVLGASGSGSGAIVTAGQGAVQFQPLEASGAGRVVIGGSATIALPVLDVAGVGVLPISAAGSPSLPIPIVFATGVVAIKGDGLAVLPMLGASGVETLPPVWFPTLRRVGVATPRRELVATPRRG